MIKKNDLQNKPLTDLVSLDLDPAKCILDFQQKHRGTTSVHDVYM